jgi:hypothetical protein
VEFQSVDQLLARFRALGATRVFCKKLSENDNSKQQIYLGGSFEVLSFFPHGEVAEHPGLAIPNFKASIDLRWTGPESIEKAPNAQLILYPKYPEVRLSGFLSGCRTAPNSYLQPVERTKRTGKDGRVLVFGVCLDRRVLVCLARAGTPLATELVDQRKTTDANGLFAELTVPTNSVLNRTALLQRLREIHRGGFHASCRLDRRGVRIPYTAPNGGGYTLEALLGITPNGDASPDFLGWEVKGFSQDRITLMTPEPTGGYYGENGVEAFVRQYGHRRPDGGLYFTGIHRVNQRCARTGMTLEVHGFDAQTGRVLDVAGGIVLADASGSPAAIWKFSRLLTHWNRKHAFAAYIPFARCPGPPAYKFTSPALLGERTDFPKYLCALSRGAVMLDPGSRVDPAGTGRTRVKARNQFRMNVRDLPTLYAVFTKEPLS